MTFEEFKKEVEKGYYAIDEIAYMCADIASEISTNKEEIDELTIKGSSYLSSVSEAEDNFKEFLKTKGIEL